MFLPASSHSHAVRALIVVSLLATAACGQITEDFNNWSDPSYTSPTPESTYVHAGVGTWVSLNAVTRAENARSGNAVRLNDEGATPWLEFRGLDGNGVDGGVGTVSFYYRHWDGDGNPVSFVLQYNENGAGWVTAGAGATVTTETTYQLFSRAIHSGSDNVKLRVLSTQYAERLLIDDFEISPGAPTPRITFQPAYVTVTESNGVVFLPVEISPAAAATVDVVRIDGDATEGADFTFASTTLVFSASVSSHEVSVMLVDDLDVETNETAVFALTNAIGAVVDPGGGQFVLTITDDEQPAIEDSIITIMSANTTSGTQQSYEDPGIRIFQALQPDVVGIQEFNVTDPGGLRGFVDTVFGTNFHYMIEGGDESIPCGVISRWPILASGEWIDPQVSNRDFAWATIDIPGDTNLHVVSVHLHGSGGASSRQIEAQNLVAQITASFPANDYIVLCGDLNVDSRTETAMTTLGAIFSDSFQPVDQFSDDDTNEPRNKPYDYVLPNTALNLRHEPLTVGGIVFPDGIVFDTRVWAPPPAPALSGDSGVSGMQHMAVMKAFSVPAAQPAPLNLTVTSPHGNPFPPVGVSTHAYASVLSPTVSDPVITLSSTQYVLTGWSGAGSVPSSGSGPVIPAFSITNDSTLTWNWETNYWLETAASGGGSVTPSPGWALAGSAIGVEAHPLVYYHFDVWTGDVPSGGETNSVLALDMAGPRTIAATFAPDTTSIGTPHWWLALYGWTNDFDAAELLDTDFDGMPAWAEYVAGTDPLLGASRFDITDASPGNSIDITVATQPGRQYSIEYSDAYGSATISNQWFSFINPTSGVFEETGLSAGSHTFEDDFGPDTTGTPAPAGTRVYRVRVAYP